MIHYEHTIKLDKLRIDFQFYHFQNILIVVLSPTGPFPNLGVERALVQFAFDCVYTC